MKDGGNSDDRRAPGTGPCGLAPRPCARGGSPDALSRALEGADSQRRGGSRRQAAPRSSHKGPGRRSGASSRSGACACTQRSAEHSADDHLRRRASARARQAGGTGGPSGRREPRRDAGQCPAPPLRRELVRDRRRRAAGNRTSHRQGHLRPAGRRKDRRRPRGTCEAVRRPFDRPALPGDRQRRAQDRSRHDRRPARPLGCKPQEDRDRRKRARQARGNSLEAAECAAGRRSGRMPARNRTHSSGPCPHGVDRSSAARRSGLWPPGKSTANS